MRLFIFSLVFATAVTAQATAPAGFHLWKASDLKARGEVLAKKVDAHKVASDIVATDGNRSFTIAHREGSGQAEWHEKMADIMVISVGHVTLVYGGTMPDGKTTAPGEMRGSEIRGGSQVELGPGDILQIPAKTPHQMKLAAGASVTYFVAKVAE
jgi:mannose-6-phosphate isomerase-like protein (cupin superfamily)